GGLGHMALKFCRAWGCEVTAFTTSASKEEEARAFGAHRVVTTGDAAALKKLAGSFDLIIDTVNASLDWPGLLTALAPKGRLHVVGVPLEPIAVPAFGLISGQKALSGSPTGSRGAIDSMLGFAARHGVAPQTEHFPMSRVNEALDHLRAGQARYRIARDADVRGPMPRGPRGLCSVSCRTPGFPFVVSTTSSTSRSRSWPPRRKSAVPHRISRPSRRPTASPLRTGWRSWRSIRGSGTASRWPCSTTRPGWATATPTRWWRITAAAAGAVH